MRLQLPEHGIAVGQLLSTDLLRQFFQDFLGVSLRWRGIPFSYNTGGTDNNNDGQIDSGDRTKQFNNMFTVGLIFVLPPKTKTTD